MTSPKLMGHKSSGLRKYLATTLRLALHAVQASGLQREHNHASISTQRKGHSAVQTLCIKHGNNKLWMVIQPERYQEEPNTIEEENHNLEATPIDLELLLHEPKHQESASCVCHGRNSIHRANEQRNCQRRHHGNLHHHPVLFASAPAARGDEHAQEVHNVSKTHPSRANGFTHIGLRPKMRRLVKVVIRTTD